MIIDKNDLDDYVAHCEMNELIDLGNKFLIKILSSNKIENFNFSSSAIDSNIAIASATTSYSRMILADIKKYCFDNNIKLYYFDADSIFTDKPLPDQFIGKEIGLWKLEAVCKEAVFIAPKVYGYIKDKGSEIIKCKGYKDKLSFNDLKSLLILNNKLNLKQDKWYKSLGDGIISIKDQIYTLKVTSNKRNLLYNKDKILYNTFPFYISQKI